MHLLQSESFGLPPLQSHLFSQLDLELPPHKHLAMQRITGTHDGQPYFIWLIIQSLHSPPFVGQADIPTGEITSNIINSIIGVTGTGPNLHRCFTASISFRLGISSFLVFAMLFVASSFIDYQFLYKTKFWASSRLIFGIYM